MEDNVVLGAISELSKTVKKLSEKVEGMNEKVEGMNNKVEGLNDKVDVMRSDMDGMRLDIDDMHGDLNQLNGKVSELNDKVNQMNGRIEQLKFVTDNRLETLEIGQKNLRNDVSKIKEDVKMLKAGQELIEYKVLDSKNELKEAIHEVDNRASRIENFIGRYTQIVENTFTTIENDNTKEHDEFKEALKLAN